MTKINEPFRIIKILLNSYLHKMENNHKINSLSSMTTSPLTIVIVAFP